MSDRDPLSLRFAVAISDRTRQLVHCACFRSRHTRADEATLGKEES